MHLITLSYKMLVMPNVLYINKQNMTPLALLLVLLIIVQNLLPVQTHTKVVVTDSGRTIIVCTLDGLKTVSLDGFSNPTNEANAPQTFTAAIQFSELMASATAAVNTFQVTTRFVPSLLLSYLHSISLKISLDRFKLIRAPPSF